MIIAITTPTSPIRFTIIAFIADLLACILVYQKLINKYEHSPTPSHPTNNCSKLSAVTKININHVNNDKYDINRAKCGSSPIYSVEYKCTNIDILVIITNIIAVKPSNCKPKSTKTHDHNCI